MCQQTLVTHKYETSQKSILWELCCFMQADNEWTNFPYFPAHKTHFFPRKM